MSWIKSNLKFTFGIGVDDNGNNITKSKTFSNVREGVANHDCVMLALDLTTTNNIFGDAVISVTKIDHTKIM